MGREFELKYRADSAALAAVREKFGDFTSISMETSYFDTPSGDLRRRRWMLRRRLENGRSVCTLKTPLPDGSRGEWETEAASPEEAIPALCRLGAPDKLARLCKQGLVLTCAARFTRLATPLDLPGCTVELALDQGCFLGGSRERPFAELEVELKQGPEDAAVSFAEELAKEFSLVPETKSKVQRALELAGL